MSAVEAIKDCVMYFYGLQFSTQRNKCILVLAVVAMMIMIHIKL